MFPSHDLGGAASASSSIGSLFVEYEVELLNPQFNSLPTCPNARISGIATVMNSTSGTDYWGNIPTPTGTFQGNAKIHRAPGNAISSHNRRVFFEQQFEGHMIWELEGSSLLSQGAVVGNNGGSATLLDEYLSSDQSFAVYVYTLQMTEGSYLQFPVAAFGSLSQCRIYFFSSFTDWSGQIIPNTQ